MEVTLDYIKGTIDTMIANGEFDSALDITTLTKFGDPGFVVVDEYPYFYVHPISDTPVSSTMGLAGYEVRRLGISVGLCTNASDYFDASVDELPGVRQLVRAMPILRARLMRLSASKLDGSARSMNVAETNYVPDQRDEVFVAMAVTTLVVEKQYQHEV